MSEEFENAGWLPVMLTQRFKIHEDIDGITRRVGEPARELISG
jgi:hypothetical protein